VTTSRGADTGGNTAAGPTSVVIRHALPDRLFHWLSAACVLTLLGTAFLPILGVEFGWVTVHWIAGLVLTVLVVFHIIRVLVRRTLGAMWVGGADVRDGLAIIGATLRHQTLDLRTGKYSVAQKLIHHAFAVVVLTTVVTGGLMLLRIDTPWWQRNPYVLPDATWGIVYVLHGLAALMLITMVMMHVYFALRPEKLSFTRAMIRGWITRAEFDEHHDPKRWQVDR
ncbi:MAG TPA: cytochrome b/b6 domain-containing protein, partial [Gammaproteobacteria bacterium]